jgi:CheY-like chemotaxis protein
MTDKHLTILAVEDEALIAMELEDLLGDLGYRVAGPASSVSAAIALLGRSLPDAAVVDANLAGESAWPIVEALERAGIPLVLASGYELSELPFAFNGPLVSKPYRARNVGDALNVVLNTSKPVGSPAT